MSDSNKKSTGQDREVRYLTAKQVAARYGQRLSWVYGCRTLPRRKVGKYLVFREDELEEFEKRWQKATPSYRTYTFQLQSGLLPARDDRPENLKSHNDPQSEEVERPKFKLLMDIK